MSTASGAQQRHECAEQERHKAQRRALIDVEAWLGTYQDEHGLSDIDLLGTLSTLQGMLLRYLDRDDEEQRTGFRHRMAGE